MTQRDLVLVAVLITREQRVQGGVEIDHAGVDETEQGDRGEQLRHRGEVEQVVGM